MKTKLILLCVMLGLGLMAGCATCSSGCCDSSAAPKVSGYVDTSAQKKL
jgi:hypothetical protein